jgi:hypothetical protein
MPEFLIDEYLQSIDDAFPPSYDEWLAMEADAGRVGGAFSEYLEAIEVYGL